MNNKFVFFILLCRISVQILKFVRLGHSRGLARRYFRATVMLQLQATLEPNWAATPRPMVPSTRVTWTVCFEGLTTSNCPQSSGYVGWLLRCWMTDYEKETVRLKSLWSLDQTFWLLQWIRICKNLVWPLYIHQNTPAVHQKMYM